MTAAPGPAARVDAHHHVWDLSARPQTWMAGDQYQPIARSFGVAELHPQAAAQGVTASVVVQSVGDPAETPELVALAETDSLVAAVVGWVELTRPGVGDRIAQLQAGPGGHRLSGVRHQVHTSPTRAGSAGTTCVAAWPRSGPPGWSTTCWCGPSSCRQAWRRCVPCPTSCSSSIMRQSHGSPPAERIRPRTTAGARGCWSWPGSRTWCASCPSDGPGGHGDPGLPDLTTLADQPS